MSFRTAIASIMFLAFVLPLYAQMPMPPMPGMPGPVQDFRQRGEDQAIAAVQQALGLTDAQVASLKGLLETRRQATQTASRDVREKRQALENLLGQAGVSPDPTQVGNALLAVRAAQRQIEAANTAFQNGFRALLTATQAQTYDAVQRAASQIAAFRGLGLLGGPDGRPRGLGFGVMRRR